MNVSAGEVKAWSSCYDTQEEEEQKRGEERRRAGATRLLLTSRLS